MASINSILITDDVNEKCVQILENNNFRVVKNTKLSKDDLLNEIKVNFPNLNLSKIFFIIDKF